MTVLATVLRLTTTLVLIWLAVFLDAKWAEAFLWVSVAGTIELLALDVRRRRE